MTPYPARYNKIMSGYEAEFIDIPHAYAFGKTLRELREYAGEVLASIFNDYLLDGEELPKPSEAKGGKILWIEPHSLTQEQCCQHSSDSDFEELLTALHSGDPRIRENALLTLRRTRRKRAREAMISMLSDLSARVRAGAVLGVVEQGTIEAVPVLRTMLSDSDGLVRVFSIMALSDFDPSSGPLIEPLLNDHDRRVRSMACMSLAQLNHSDAIPEIRALLNDPDTGVRSGACYALGKLGDTESTENLVKATDDSDVSVRYEAARALFSLGHPEGRKVLEEIIERKESPGFIKTRPFLRTVRYVLAGNL
ncbi:MAG: HEAT repeat domain-containing protein [Vulcanimicrobiota bacterium]